MPTRATVIDELNFLSKLLSDRVRSSAAVLLAFCWAFIVEGAAANGGFLAPAQVVPSLLLAFLCLLADFTQYAAGLRLNLRTLKRMERLDIAETAYDSRDPLYRLRQFMFVAKMLLLGAALLWMLAAVTIRLLAT